MGHSLFESVVVLTSVLVAVQWPAIKGNKDISRESPIILPSDLGDIFVQKGKDAYGICYQVVSGNNGLPLVTKGYMNRQVTKLYKFTFDGSCLNITARDVTEDRYMVSVSNLFDLTTATFRLVYCEVPGIHVYFKGNSGYERVDDYDRIWVNLGDRVDVQCKKSGAPRPDLTWFHDGRFIRSVETKQRCLTIARVSARDHGRYTVVARNTEGATQTSFYLWINVFPVHIQARVRQETSVERPTIVPSNLGTVLARKGNDVTGICFEAVTGSDIWRGVRLTVRLRRGPRGRNITNFVLEGICLHIFAKGVKNGSYVISVYNVNGHANSTFRLIYFEVPDIRLYYFGRVLVNKQNITITAESASVAVECELSGTPTPVLRWYHHGRAINIAGNGKECFMITNVSASDAGVYTVVATNTEGFAQANFSLQLSELPKIYHFCTSFNDTLNCNRKHLELRCSASGIPSPVVGINVHMSGDTSSSSNLHSVTYREIVRNASKRNFTCSASNNYGTVSETCTIRIEIGRPPVLASKDHNTTVRVVENKTHIFNCSLASHPFPSASVTWFQGHVEKTEWRNFSIVEVITRADMHMVPFTCRVSNDCGHDARTFILDVGDLPHIDHFCTSLSEILICNLKDFEVRCSASGIPSPVVTISVSGKANSSSKLHSVTYRETIKESSDRNFTCSASNYYGTVTETCIIPIKIGRPPKLAIRDSEMTTTVMNKVGHYLNCSFASDSFLPTTVTWFQGRLKKTEWQNFSIVEVTTSADIHMVPFTCTIRNDCGHEARTFILNVEDPPQIQQFCNNMEHSVYCRIHRLELPCSATGNPSPIVTVTRKLRKLRTASSLISTVYRENLTDTTEANYTCFASNYHGNVTADCFLRITIGRPPKLAVEERSVTVKIMEGQKHRFDCSVSVDAFQAASIHWFVNSVENMDWRNLSAVVLRAGIVMHMVPIMCRVSNYCGHETRTFHLYIEAKCRIFIDADKPFLTSSLCSSETCLHLAYNQTISLTALVRCFPYRRPIRIKYFHFNQRRFIAFSRRNYIDRDGAKAVKIDLIVGRTGTYDFSVDNTRTIISVIAQPGLINDNNTGQVFLTAAHPVRKLACRTRLYPEEPGIEATWSNIKWNSATNVSKRIGTDGAVYITSTLHVKHPGRYSCLLTVAGESRLFTVKAVSVDARLVPNRTILVGESFSLLCALTIRAKIVWMHNGKNIREVEDSENTVLIHEAQQQHEGVYSCSLQGLIQKHIIVAVEAPPLINYFCSNYGKPAVLCNSNNLTLSCSGSGDPVPKITITGVGIVKSRFVDATVVASYTEVLQHTGYSNHTCSATNIHGTVKSGCYITIGKSPMFMEEVYSVKVGAEEHQTISLSCEVLRETFPPPKIQWFYGYYQELKQWNYGTFTTLTTLNLDGSTFRCIVTNDCGSKEKEFYFEVTAPCKMMVATNGNVYDMLTSTGLPLATSQFKSGMYVNLPYQETITISGQARCYPKRPTLILTDPKVREIIASSVKNFQDAESAYLTNASGIVNQVGKFTFQVQDDSATAIIDIIALPSIVTNGSEYSLTKPVILSPTMLSAVLECTARLYPLKPVIAWEPGDDISVADATVTKFTGDDGANYMKSRIVVSFPGNYSCLINDTSERRDFTVVAQPIFEKRDDELVLNQEVLPGTTVELECEILNITYATVLWYRNRENLNSWQDRGRPKLNIETRDCGLMAITCIAINKYGSTERNYSLYVAEIPLKMLLIPNRTIIKGESFLLRCITEIEGYNIELQRNGKSLQLTNNTTVDHVVENSSEREEGKYTCIAQSGNCTKNESIVVTVESPPDITNFCDHFVGCISNSLDVSCTANGDPTPTVTITRTFDSKPQLSTTSYQSAIFREMVNYTGQSSLTCLATNRHGTAIKTCHGRIGSTPQFVVKEVNTTVEEGETYALKCQIVKGDFPLVSISWFEDDNEKKEWKSSTIRWLKAKLAFNSVHFKCSVKNDCGREIKTFYQYVTAPCRIFISSQKLLHYFPNDCRSENCVHLPYGQTILLSAVARCFPQRPILSLWNEKQQQLVSTRDKDIVKEVTGAHVTFLKRNSTTVGKYLFRLYSVDVKSAIEVIALPTFVSPSMANATHFVILTDDRRSHTLVCNARSYPRHPHIEWSSNVAVTVPSRSTFTGDDGAIYLKSKLVVDAVGTYSCLLKLSSGQETFIVNAAPMFETMWNESALNISASLRSKVQLDCKLLNSLESSIEWFDDQREVLRWRNQSQPYLGIRLGHCGEMTFSCRVKNPYGIARRTFVINVRDVTVTAIIVPGTTVATGANIRLRCIVERNGYSMRWERNQSVIGQSTTGNRNLTLTVSNATPSNEGKYECIAWRNNCTVKSSVFLNVEVPPRIEDYCPSETVHCRKNSLELTCKASGDPPPQVMIKRKGFLSSVTGIHPGLAVYRGNVTQIGNNVFVCNAKNRQGEATKACHITTFSAPRFVNNFLAMLVRQGRQVHLRCHLVGKWLLPITNVIWYEGSIEKKEWNNKQTVSWIATLADHLKEYRCKVTNLCGSSIRQFSLYVT